MKRIQIACHADVWDGDDWLPFLDAAAEAGYDGVEGVEYLYRRYSDEVELGKILLTSRRLRLLALSERGDLVIPDKREEIIKTCLRLVEFLQRIGADILILETGSRIIAENIRHDFRVAAATLNELGKRCKDFNVNLCIQPRVGDRIQQEEEIDRILSELDEREVFFCPDTGQLLRAEMDPAEILKIYGSCVKHIHLSDVPMPASPDSPETESRTFCPPGQGIIDFEGIIAALQSIRYTGCAAVRFNPDERDSMEQDPMEQDHIGKDPTHEILEAKRYLEPLFEERKRT